jgi:hypothetical protein
MRTTNRSSSNRSSGVRFVDSLFGRFLIAFVVVGLLPLLAVGTFGYTFASTAIIRQAQERLETAAQLRFDQVYKAITSKQDTLTELVDLPGIAGEATLDAKLGAPVLLRTYKHPKALNISKPLPPHARKCTAFWGRKGMSAISS